MCVILISEQSHSRMYVTGVEEPRCDDVRGG